jgi:hypothetical protein
LYDCRVVPRRELHPIAYRLYMELVKQNVFKLESHIYYSNYEMWGLTSVRYEIIHVFFVFCDQIVSSLMFNLYYLEFLK